MKNDKLFKELDKYNKRRALKLYKSMLWHIKDLPKDLDKHYEKGFKKKLSRDEIIAFNLAMMLTWGDITI
jgi:hypothetical protein